MVFTGFKSKFKKNDQLKKCAVNDPDHISVNFNSTGEHVALIQEALNKWLVNTGQGQNIITGAEKDNKKFGPMTHKAVDIFKRAKDIRNYKNEIDQVVGKKTVVALDLELPVDEDVNPKPETSVAIVPFNEIKPLLIAHEADNRMKGDLESTKSEPKLPLTPQGIIARNLLTHARITPTFALVQEMRTELLVAGEAGAAMVNTFVANGIPKAVITFGVGNIVCDLIRKSDEFRDVKADFVRQMKEVLDGGIRTSNTLDYRFLSHEKFGRLEPPMVSFGAKTSTRLKFAVGSTQGVDVFLEDFTADNATRRWNATLILAYFDHFGSDDSDLIPDSRLHGSPGQVGLWVLARERNPGHMPFVSKMMLQEQVSESF